MNYVLNNGIDCVATTLCKNSFTASDMSIPSSRGVLFVAFFTLMRIRIASCKFYIVSL